MKKRFIVIILVSLLTGLAFAGGGADGDGAAEEQVTIRLLSRFTGTDATTPVWQDAIEQFQERNPNVTIQDDSVNQEAAYNNKLQTGLATGNLPNIFYSPGVVSNVRLAENGVILDVTPLMEDKEWFDGFIEGAFEVWNFDTYGVPGYYGVPYSVAPEIFIYNKVIFAEAGIDSPPETMEELYEAFDKLNAIGVTPIAAGAKSTWRSGHIHNYLLYKSAGVETAVKLGARQAKWTDPEVVNSLALMKDLKERGAFWPNFEGIDYDMEKVMFFNGEAAMVLNGSWFVGDVINSENPDDFGTFPFPYFEDKPQFKGHTVNFPQGFQLKGNYDSEAEKQATIDFIKFWTGQERQQIMVAEIQRMSVRTDLDYDSIDLSHIFLGYTDALAKATMLGGDSFDYDPLNSMADRTRNSIIGMLLGASPQEAAEEIQAEIDQNE